MSEKLKRAVIKEELVHLTGNYIDAIILNQFIYWADRVDDFDSYQREEQEISQKSGADFSPNYSHGWIFKSAEKLSAETMLGLSASNIRKHIQPLIDKGFLSERSNPKYKWDKTKQYRVRLSTIQGELKKLGYTLEGYKIDVPISDIDVPFSKTEDGSAQNETAIPETTIETTLKTTVENKREPSTDKFCGHEFSEPIQEKLTEWLTYKSERREGYKPTGLKSFMTEVSNKLEKYTEEDVISLIGESMANNWKGICWDKLKGMEKPPEPVDKPIPQEILDAQKRREEGIRKLKSGEGSWRDLIL